MKTTRTTHLNKGVNEASELMRRQDQRKVLLLLTDGFDTTLGHPTLRHAVQAALEADAIIYCIALTDLPRPPPCRPIPPCRLYRDHQKPVWSGRPAH